MQRSISLTSPLGGVDSKTERYTLELLEELRDSGKTIIVVTHDLQSLQRYFDQVLLINRKKIAFGQPSDVLTERNLKHAYGGHMHIQSISNAQGE